jgi:hypothetical protein
MKIEQDPRQANRESGTERSRWPAAIAIAIGVVVVLVLVLLHVTGAVGPGAH